MMLEEVSFLLISAATVAVLGSNSCPSAAAESCHSPWKSWGDSCYSLVSQEGTWDYAQEACLNVGGLVAAPRSLAENAYMVGVARSESGDYRLWIGCTDEEREGKWVCEGQGNGEPFFNWLDGQPNNKTGENYAGTKESAAGKWLDWQGDFQRQAVCVRRSLAAVPTPSQPTCGPRQHQPRRFCFSTGPDGQLLHSCLLGHVIREFAATSSPSCASACVTEPGCRSFNFRRNEEGQKLCQLSSATRCDDSGQFQDTGSFCIYAHECVD